DDAFGQAEADGEVFQVGGGGQHHRVRGAVVGERDRGFFRNGALAVRCGVAVPGGAPDGAGGCRGHYRPPSFPPSWPGRTRPSAHGRACVDAGSRPAMTGEVGTITPPPPSRSAGSPWSARGNSPATRWGRSTARSAPPSPCIPDSSSPSPR